MRPCRRLPSRMMPIWRGIGRCADLREQPSLIQVVEEALERPAGRVGRPFGERIRLRLCLANISESHEMADRRAIMVGSVIRGDGHVLLYQGGMAGQGFIHDFALALNSPVRRISPGARGAASSPLAQAFLPVAQQAARADSRSPAWCRYRCRPSPPCPGGDRLSCRRSGSRRGRARSGPYTRCPSLGAASRRGRCPRGGLGL